MVELLNSVALVAAIAAINIACGGFASFVAVEKNFSGGSWFFLGVLFGPIALLAVCGLPVKQNLVPQVRPSGILSGTAKPLA
jgi:hypothetical protein